MGAMLKVDAQGMRLLNEVHAGLWITLLRGRKLSDQHRKRSRDGAVKEARE
jgi:hypothetical protein